MYVKVKVKAGSKSEKVLKRSEDSYEIDVREPAERNLANERVIELLRIEFPNAKIVRIINGHHSPQKLVSID